MGRGTLRALTLSLLLGGGSTLATACGILAPLEEVAEPTVRSVVGACNRTAYVAHGDAPMLDDFEDKDTAFLRADGRGGNWEDWSPRDSKGKQVNGRVTFKVEEIPEELARKGKSRHAAHFVVRDMQLQEGDAEYPYAGFGGRLLGHKLSCYDASKYTGVGFWARGSGQPISLQLATEATLPTSEEFVDRAAVDVGEHGDCVEGDKDEADVCFDHFQLKLDLREEWTYYRVSWEQLAQQGWGSKAAFALSELVQISFDVTEPHVQDTDLWIDDVRFLQEESRCAGLTESASESAALLDDFEREGLSLSKVDARSGKWTSDDDGTGDPIEIEEVDAGATITSERALHVGGGRYTDWGGGVRVDFNEGCYNLLKEPDESNAGDETVPKVYEGLSFWARSGARRVGEPLYLRATLATADTSDDCVTELDHRQCYAGFGKHFELSEDWELYSFVWDEAAQLAGGDQRPLNLDRATGVVFTAPPVSGEQFDFFLDDVRFLVDPLPGTGERNGRLGSACEAPWGCAAGLSCVASDDVRFGGGGAAGGICTAECKTTHDCTDFDEASVCGSLPGVEAKYCLESCAIGGDAESKCHARSEAACRRQTGAACKTAVDCEQSSCVDGFCIVDVCVPNCNVNDDCGPGLYCHTARGLCKSDPPENGDNGSLDCSACRGACIEQSTGDAALEICADRCTVGSPNACGYEDDPGACVLVDSGAAEPASVSAGDLAWCAALCDCQSPCSSDALKCIRSDEDSGYCGVDGEALNCGASAPLG